MGQGAWRDLAHGSSSTGYAKEEGRSHLEDQLDRLLDQPVEFLNSTGQASTRSSWSQTWPVELRNSTGWSSRRSSWSSGWLLPSFFAYPVELLPCAKFLHAPYVPYAPECSKRPIPKDQTCICMQMQPKTNMNA
ncbi:unnamed protein product [Microthlaspi erraticum]|uniref:Uncharacterized protein n=1 Tax=Microthlaspi erraticum TaxID=1685480 RepID=A0A6D2KLR6_9BRAS|nr:unnamed protein product [Microthlaspi erraticum]